MPIYDKSHTQEEARERLSASEHLHNDIFCVNLDRAIDKSKCPEGVLPKVDIDNATMWFETRGMAFDKNKDSALSDREIDDALKGTIDKTDRANLQMLGYSAAFFESGRLDGWIDRNITKADMREFKGWVNEVNGELNTFKRNSPEDYGAISFLNNNFSWLDKNNSGKVSHDEVRTALRRDGLSDSHRKDLERLDAKFETIAETTRVSQTSKIIDDTAGYERQIGPRAIAQFVTNANIKADPSRRFESVLHPLKYMNRLNAFVATEELRTYGYVVFKQMFGSPS